MILRCFACTISRPLAKLGSRSHSPTPKSGVTFNPHRKTNGWGSEELGSGAWGKTRKIAKMTNLAVICPRPRPGGFSSFSHASLVCPRIFSRERCKVHFHWLQDIIQIPAAARVCSPQAGLRNMGAFFILAASSSTLRYIRAHLSLAILPAFFIISPLHTIMSLRSFQRSALKRALQTRTYASEPVCPLPVAVAILMTPTNPRL